MPITLTVIAGPHAGREFTFPGHDAFLVGRSKHAHFRLPPDDVYFSRIHFMVEVNPPRCCLVDMGSLNGTAVNGREVEPGQVIELADGDRIEGGDTVFRLSVSADGPEPAPAEETAPWLAPPATPPPQTDPARCRACEAGVPGGTLLCPACEGLSRGMEQVVAGYRVVRELGRGSMGVVVLAVRELDGACVALKTIRPAMPGSRGQVARFLREANILRGLDHPNIIAFRDMGESGGQLYFAMDYVRGADAGRLLKEQGPFEVGRAVGLVGQLLDGLDYAHRKGFVHRDIKPANLLVAREGGCEVARLADFGLARVYAASRLSGLTLAGDVGGTLAFMAPEQITRFREAKPAADLYSAAATLYNLLTGRFLFDFPRRTEERLQMILEGTPVPIRERRPDVPDRVAGAIHRALARDPGRRFADAAAMARALRG